MTPGLFFNLWISVQCQFWSTERERTWEDQMEVDSCRLLNAFMYTFICSFFQGFSCFILSCYVVGILHAIYVCLIERTSREHDARCFISFIPVAYCSTTVKCFNPAIGCSCLHWCSYEWDIIHRWIWRIESQEEDSRKTYMDYCGRQGHGKSPCTEQIYTIVCMQVNYC